MRRDWFQTISVGLLLFTFPRRVAPGEKYAHAQKGDFPFLTIFGCLGLFLGFVVYFYFPKDYRVLLSARFAIVTL